MDPTLRVPSSSERSKSESNREVTEVQSIYESDMMDKLNLDPILVREDEESQQAEPTPTITSYEAEHTILEYEAKLSHCWFD
jgi:hypothetical protein